MADTLFKQLCSPDLLKMGWHLAHLDSRDDFVSDPVGYEDFASHLTQRLSYLIHEIRDRRYRPRYLLDVDIPKSGLSVRPGNVLPIEEATILHAIVYLLAPRLDRFLPPNVHSYRLHPKWKERVQKGKGLFKSPDKDLPFLKSSTIRHLSPFSPWYVAWPEFDRLRIQAAREQGFTHLTRTDIVSYFENIDLRLLDAQLRSLARGESKVMELLMRILESWTRVTSTGTSIGRGIPQGNDASSILANIYLLPLDRALVSFCSHRNAIWYRYVDDVEIYSKDYATARDVVFVINDALRELYLNLQGSKTEILFGVDLDEVLATSEFEAVDQALTALQGVDVRARKNRANVTFILRNLREPVSRFRSQLPRSVHNLSKKDNRLLRRLMTLYGRCGRPHFRRTALAVLRGLPELRMLQKSLRYLQQMDYRHHEELLEELLSMVEEDAFPLPYQAASVLGALRYLHPQNAGVGVAGRVSAWALRRKRDWIIRQKALEVLSTIPYREEYSIRQADNFLLDHHPFVRRAACVLLTRGPVEAVRTKVNDLVYDPDPSITHLALLWRRYITDRSFALREIGRIKKAHPRDANLVDLLPRIWLMRCSSQVEVVKGVRGDILPLLKKSHSRKLNWHHTSLDTRTQWAG